MAKEKKTKFKIVLSDNESMYLVKEYPGGMNSSIVFVAFSPEKAKKFIKEKEILD